MITDNTVLDRLVEKLGSQTRVQAHLQLTNAQTINWWRKRGIAWGMRVKVHALARTLDIAIPDGWIMTPPKGQPSPRKSKLGRPPKPKRTARSRLKRRHRNGIGERPRPSVA